jgi:signal transduction histidine kinase
VHGSDPRILFKTLKRYIGFTKEDSALLASFYPHVEPHLEVIVGEFYARIQKSPGAAAVITDGHEQVARFKGMLREWLRRLLMGPHDGDFAALQARVGRQHVNVGLEQAFMVAGIHVFRVHLDSILGRSFPPGSPGAAEIQRAYVRCLDIVLALMLQTYREDSLKRILQTEQNATTRRLAALGEVAASIAHEVRNPLAGISGAIQVLSQDRPPEDPELEILKEILNEIQRLDSRVNDLLLYARPSVPAREPAKPRELLKTTLAVMSEDPLFKRVKVTIDAPASLPPFPMDAEQIQQVVINLVLNALQTLNGAGRIRLEARLVEGGALEMAVEDSGPGVPEEIAREVFRPFFTTRRSGTGLGLAISRKIVEAHGGSLDLERGRNGLNRFVFQLPFPLEEVPIYTGVG